MATIITLLTDLALGALAYRLAAENRGRIKKLESTVNALVRVVKMWGVKLDDHRD